MEGGFKVNPTERTQVEDGLDSRKERIVGILAKRSAARPAILLDQLLNLDYRNSQLLEWGFSVPHMWYIITTC